MEEYTRNDKTAVSGGEDIVGAFCIASIYACAIVFRKNTEKLFSFYGFP